jgi:hypothetical protein
LVLGWEDWGCSRQLAGHNAHDPLKKRVIDFVSACTFLLVCWPVLALTILVAIPGKHAKSAFHQLVRPIGGLAALHATPAAEHRVIGGERESKSGKVPVPVCLPFRLMSSAEATRWAIRFYASGNDPFSANGNTPSVELYVGCPNFCSLVMGNSPFTHVAGHELSVIDDQGGVDRRFICACGLRLIVSRGAVSVSWVPVR